MSTPIAITATDVAAPKPTVRPPPDLSQPFLTFPPFPTPPPGVSITPFKQFKPAGIRITLDAHADDVELDGTGVPTVELRVKHDLTEAEQRKRRRPRAAPVEPGGRRPAWFEEWAVAESNRRTLVPIDPSISRADRLHQASHDFKSGRDWPALTSGVQQLWDSFRLYIGLISNIQPPMSRKRAQMLHAAQAVADADAESDDDADGVGDGAPRERTVAIIDEEEARTVQEERFATQRPPDTEERQARREHFHEAKDQRMDAFFNDTELNMKVFFSSYFRTKGLMWDEQRARNAPIIVGFWLNFLLRNRVLPEPEYEKCLRKALVIIEHARTELPASFVVARSFPDKFGEGCKELFGSMEKCDWRFLPDAEKKEAESDERDAKRRKLDDADDKKDEQQALKEAVREAIVDVASSEVAKDIAQDLQYKPKDEENGEEKEETDTAARTAANGEWGVPADGGWGAPLNGGWGAPVDGGWSAPVDAEKIDVGDDTWNEDIADSWNFEPQPNPLMAFLGPTLLPLTHTTGIVERSTRRIARVEAAQPTAQKTKAKKKKGRSSAELVEEELGRRFAKMVLVPWQPRTLHDPADITVPVILPDSRGTVVPVNGQDTQAAGDAGAAHNPYKDEIILLIDPSIADKMVVGMGLGATWIQVVRQDLAAAPQSDPSEKNEEAKGGWGEAGQPTPYWYVEKVYSVLPSFHVEPNPEP